MVIGNIPQLLAKIEKYPKNTKSENSLINERTTCEWQKHQGTLALLLLLQS